MSTGDLLLACTDGVTEAAGPEGELFSAERMRRLLSHPADSAQALVDRIVNRVSTHTGDAEQFDDITLLALQRCPSASGTCRAQ
jgi:serine phosphatase RsbU (regulator of sigma subunit)